MNDTYPITLDQQFFFGGNATFTVESKKTGEHKTFKIRQTKPSPQFPNQSFMVSLLSGSDNETSYSYIGITNPLDGNLRLTKASKRTANSSDVITFNWLMKHLFTDKTLTNAVVHHVGKCGCCGRTLTVPESIERGIGPECWNKLNG
jgi:hypothetical protein